MPSTTASLCFINSLGYFLNTLVTYGIGVLHWWNLPDNATLSAKYQTLVTPAGWAFSIWGLIFMSQLVWVLSQYFLVRGQKSRTSSLQHRKNIAILCVEAVGYDYLWVCLLQIAWTVSFSLELIQASIVSMYLITTFLNRIVVHLQAIATDHINHKGILEYSLYSLPFTLHAGWITAAIYVNFNFVLVWLKVAPQTQFLVASASLLILLGTAVGLIIDACTAPIDLVQPLVLAWALVGVYFELVSPSTGIVENFAASKIAIIQYSAAAGVGIIIPLTAVKLLRLSSSSSRRSTKTP